MGEIVIRNGSTGESKVFQPTREGQAAADAYARQILQQGHQMKVENGNPFILFPNFGR
ncbi:hypothetical protein IKE83_00995 [Candidatus Saccharibacteria bacterium]|nr:hypothetical protein [Candidatus Saccharibacteria bacterium]